MSLIKNLKRREVEIFGAKRVVRNDIKKAEKDFKKFDEEAKKNDELLQELKKYQDLISDLKEVLK